jgi:hypothetical protein
LYSVSEGTVKKCCKPCRHREMNESPYNSKDYLYKENPTEENKRYPQNYRK